MHLQLKIYHALCHMFDKYLSNLFNDFSSGHTLSIKFYNFGGFLLVYISL